MALSSDSNYGQHSSDNYVLGRGVLHADIYDSNNTKTGRFLDLGNCTAFGLNVDEETLEHESSRGGLKTVDASVTLKKAVSGTFTLDEITRDNLAMFLSGDVTETALSAGSLAAATNSVVLGVSGEEAEIPGKWYEITDAAGARVYNLSAVSIYDDASKTTTYVLDTDYKLDLVRGLVFVVVGGDIDTDDALSITIDATIAAGTQQDVQILQETSFRAAILFAGENSQTGEKFEVRLHSCKISADGDASFIGDEFLEMGFNFVIEEVTDSAYASSPYGTIRKFPAT